MTYRYHGEDEDGVFREAFVVEKLSELTYVIVNVGNHPKEVREVDILILVRLAGCFGSVHRSMQCIGGYVRKKGLAFAF